MLNKLKLTASDKSNTLESVENTVLKELSNIEFDPENPAAQMKICLLPW